MIPIVYRWDDANAPVARGERRSLCDILYACLVTGYGDKPAAGWTRPYVNATFDKAVFRNNPATGTGFYLQVDGYGAATAYQSLCRAFEVMTDVDTGLFPFDVAQICHQSYSVGTTARPWILIADDLFFYLWIWTGITAAPQNTDYSATGMAFGDIVKNTPSDSYACCLAINPYPSRHPVCFIFPPSATTSSVGNSMAFPRPSSGVSSPFFASMIRGGGPGADTFPGANGLSYTAGDPILVSRPHVNNGAAYTFRGYAPGLYYPCHPLAFNQLAEIAVDGKTFLSIRSNIQSTPGNIFIDLGDWRA